MRTKLFQQDRIKHLVPLFFLSSILAFAVSMDPLFAEEVEVIDFGEELSSSDDSSPSTTSADTTGSNPSNATEALPSSDTSEVLDFGNELDLSDTNSDIGTDSTSPISKSPSSENSAKTTLDRTQFYAEWHTLLRADLGWSTSEDVFEADNGLKLSLNWEQSNHFRVVISGHISYWLGVSKPIEDSEETPWIRNPHYALTVGLDEAYLNWRFDEFSLTLGNVVVSWGSTVLSQPANVVNVIDRTVILGPSAGKRIAQPSLVLDVFKGNWGLQFLLVPFFTPNTQWIFGRDSASVIADNTIVRNSFPIMEFLPVFFFNFASVPLQHFLLSAGTPSLSPLNASAGIRFTGTFANTDIGIGYFFGWDHDPMIQIDPSLRAAMASWSNLTPSASHFADPTWWTNQLTPFLSLDPSLISFDPKSTQSLITLSYERLHSVEVDFSRYFGQIGVKFDAVAHPEKTFITTQLKSVQRPNLSAALELNWDHLFSDNSLLSLNLGGFFDYAASANASLTKAFVSPKRRGHASDDLLLYPNGMLGGLAFQGFSYINAPELTIQLFLRTDLTKPDLLAWLDVSRPLFGDIRIALGLLFFAGPPVEKRFSAGGLYKRDSAVYLSLTGAI